MTWLARLRLRRCARVGRRPTVDGSPLVFGGGTVEIGDDFVISAIPVRSHLFAARGARLAMGDRVRISHGAAIATVQRIDIGSDVRIGPYAVISDSDFHKVGDRNAAAEPRPVSIGSGVRLGTRVTVLPGSTIGEGAVVQAGSTVGGEIPAGSVAAGVPARPLRRGGESISSEDPGSAVPFLVMRAFGLAAPPRPDEGPAEIGQWDSFGTLKLIVSLEEELCVTLAADEVARVTRVRDLVSLVDAARRRAASG